MKVVLKQKPITIEEAIIVSDESCGELVSTDTLTQRLFKQDERFVLYEESSETNDTYESIGSIRVFCKEGDILIFNGIGYTKPLAQYIEINEEQEKLINEYNEIIK